LQNRTIQHVPFYLQIWPSSTASQLLLAGAVLLLLALVIGMWLLTGRGPRRRRRLKAAMRLLQQGDWQRALQVIQHLQGKGRLSFAWQSRFWSAEGECHRAAMTHALAEKNYESAMEHGLAGAHLLKQKEADARAFVIEAMLGEVRRLFANSLGNDTSLAQELIGRTLALQTSGSPEAHFWQGLCYLREGRTDRAIAALQAARGEEDDEAAKKSSAVEPPLYLGALLLRQGRAKDALRYLTEANRIDGNCPFVTWQLGTAILQAGGDAQLAVRALQRALGSNASTAAGNSLFVSSTGTTGANTGPRGFGMWVKEPARAWVEGFPENRSFVRKLARKHAFLCPLWGSDLQAILRQGNIALGQGLHRLGQFQEAADVFSKLLQESAPSLPVLRGLGLALARLGQYDPAFKHLRTAHEMEDPKDRTTAGYLALCGARGKPTRPEDKVRNVTWAIRLVDQFTAPGDAEWAGLVSAIFAEARALALPIDANDQIYLCEHLLSVHATDPLAAEAYHHLAGTHPQDLRSEYAWLFCRAAQEHGVGGAYSPALFARTFAEEQRAREFFAQRKWDFDAIELTYLQRAAEVQPGSFPAALGPDYPPRGEKLLLEKSQQEEQAGNQDAALAHAQVLVQLAPASTRAHDRLAYLHHRRGDLARAAELLGAWHRLEPNDPVPLVRRAVIYQGLGDAGRCLDTVRVALAQTTGAEHARIAFLGARLLLKSSESSPTNGEAAAGDGTPAAHASGSDMIRRSALELLEDCLQHDPQHVEASWCLAAVRSLLGDDAGLGLQSAQMDRPEVGDPRFHFLGGVCNLAAKNYAGVLEACRRTTAACEKQGTKKNELSLAVESAYLAGWAYWLQEDLTSAARFLQTPAQATSSASQAHARALLGRVYFAGRNYKEAARWWQTLEPKQRTAWKFVDTLAGTMFLSALEAFRDGRYPDAAEKLREAGRLGLRDRRLGLLLSLSLVKAGQQCMYADNDN
jgi:tetratricopeptide (TPR) repeat protein